MSLTKIDLMKFRGAKDLSIPLRNKNYLIGENNSGKSTVIDAVRFCMSNALAQGNSVFEPYDFHFERGNTEPAVDEDRQIEIRLTYAEQEVDEWLEIEDVFDGIIEPGSRERRKLVLQVTCLYDSIGKSYKTKFGFITERGDFAGENNSTLLMALQHQYPLIFLSSTRDAKQVFHENNIFWRTFLHEFETDRKKSVEIAEKLAKVNEEILSDQESVKEFVNRLEKIQDLLPIGSNEPITVEAIPTKMFELVEGIQLNLESKTGVQIPVTRHGSGTQSLAVIHLYETYLSRFLGPKVKPILIIEEPEAHLHPSAVKAVDLILNNTKAQTLVSTHSGDLLSDVDFEDIILLLRKEKAIVCNKLNKEEAAKGLSKDQSEKMWNELVHHVREDNGKLLFARCLVLLEGKSDAIVVSNCARVMGIDLKSKGVYVVEYSQSNLEHLIRLADQFGIEFLALFDGDSAGQEYLKTASDLLGSRNSADHLFVLDYGNLEDFLENSGFKRFYARPEGEGINKVSAARGVSDEMVLKGIEQVPQLFKELINQALKLARGSG